MAEDNFVKTRLMKRMIRYRNDVTGHMLDDLPILSKQPQLLLVYTPKSRSFEQFSNQDPKNVFLN